MTRCGTGEPLLTLGFDRCWVGTVLHQRSCHAYSTAQASDDLPQESGASIVSGGSRYLSQPDEVFLYCSLAAIDSAQQLMKDAEEPQSDAANGAVHVLGMANYSADHGNRGDGAGCGPGGERENATPATTDGTQEIGDNIKLRVFSSAVP